MLGKRMRKMAMATGRYNAPRLGRVGKMLPTFAKLAKPPRPQKPAPRRRL